MELCSSYSCRRPAEPHDASTKPNRAPIPAPQARQLQLVPAHSIANAHTDTIFTLALDPAHSQFVSGEC